MPPSQASSSSATMVAASVSTACARRTESSIQSVAATSRTVKPSVPPKMVASERKPRASIPFSTASAQRLSRQKRSQ